jgi:hypothetical protein
VERRAGLGQEAALLAAELPLHSLEPNALGAHVDGVRFELGQRIRSLIEQMEQLQRLWAGSARVGRQQFGLIQRLADTVDWSACGGSNEDFAHCRHSIRLKFLVQSF